MSLSKTAISKQTGLALSTVKRFFHPKGNPTLKTAIKIAKYFNVSLDVVNQLRNQEVKRHVEASSVSQTTKTKGEES